MITTTYERNGATYSVAYEFEHGIPANMRPGGEGIPPHVIVFSVTDAETGERVSYEDWQPELQEYLLGLHVGGGA